MDKVKSSHEIAFLVFMVLVAALGNQNPFFQYPQILWSFLALLVFNLGNLIFLERRLSPKISAALSLTANNFLITAILYFSGGHESYFWVLLLLPIFTACLLLERRSIYAMIALEAGVLGVFYILQSGGVWLAVLEWASKAGTLIICGVMTMTATQGERLAKKALSEEHEKGEHEKQELSRLLQHADRLATVGTLVASLAHDINNPLTAILGITQIHGPGARHREEWGDDLETVEQAAMRIQELVQRLLSFSRRQAAQPELHDVNGLLRQCLAFKKYDWTRLQIKIIEDYDQTAPKLRLVATQFQQVIFNLLVNAQHAIRSAKPGGRIWIRTQQVGGHLRVVVEDDGPGIPPELASRIFEPFFTTKPEGEGTGLGLSICRQIIRGLRGTLSVRSSLGTGASFIIELPHTCEEAISAGGLVGSPAARTSRKSRILVAEDEAPIVEILKRVLGPLGHALSVVGSFDDAIRHIRKEAPDMFLTDLKMPGMEAREFFDLLKREGRHAQFPVLAISGSIEGTGLDDLLSERKIPYLAKPFKISELKDVVEKALGRRSEAGVGSA